MATKHKAPHPANADLTLNSPKNMAGMVASMAEKLGTEASFALMTVGVFVHYRVSDLRLMVFALIVLWSLLAFRLLWQHCSRR